MDSVSLLGIVISMPAPHVSPLPQPSLEATVMNAYRWLLLLGFPSNEAAASLMPELFTNEPAPPPEKRPA